MKAIRNKIGRLIVGCVFACCLTLNISSFAIDGLKLSVQSSDVVLTWPSLEGETYVVQYRPTLNLTDSWQTLSAAWPADTGTNFTSYTHYGIVQYPPADSGGGGGSQPAMMSGSEAAFDSSRAAAEPMVMRADGSGSAVPLAIYPPGFDLSGSIIFDPATGERVRGNGYTVKAASNRPSGGMQPMDFSTDSTNQYTGFYRVLGVRLAAGLTNGMTASDFINIQTRPEVGSQYIRLIANGLTYPMQNLLLPPYTNTNSVTFSVDTARLANGGPYTLQVEGTWQDPTAILRDDGLLKAVSQPIAIYVTNELSYPDWDDYVNDDSDSFYVRSAHPVADWEIDVYNYHDYFNWYYGYTNNISPIHVATGSTTNGLIEYHWDLIDDNGNLRTNKDIDPYFVSFTYTSWSGNGGLSENAARANGVHPNAGGGGGSAEKANPFQQQSAPWPSDGGYWIVGYQNMFRHYYDSGNLMPQMLNAWLGAAGGIGLGVFYKTPIGGTNAQTFPLRYQYPKGHWLYDSNFNDDGEFNDYDLFRAMIQDPRARNFYYFGHADEDNIGNGVHATPTIALGLTHRYRFVWVDGCDTANGDLDRLFNINGPGLFSLGYYQERSKRPAVFIGHNQTIPLGIPGETTQNGITYDGRIPDSVPYFRINFLIVWQYYGYTLKSAIDYGKANTPERNMHYLDGSLAGQHYAPGDALQIEGYDDMHYNEFNAAGDIPRP